MAEITAEQVSATFEIGVEWLDGQLGRSEAVKLLATRHGLNAVSAGDLLQVLRAMHNGERFTRSISAPAADAYLGRIFSTVGPKGLKTAIEALDQHLAYYESIRPVTLHKLRSVRDKWSETLASEPQATDVMDRLEEQVDLMLAASKAERLKKLPEPGAKPSVSYAQVRVFNRSAAVIAEVRLRADGKCESCKRPAPFLRAKDGKPYLEVHHKHQLALGGEDSVDNAIAICPNCHRKAHFG